VDKPVERRAFSHKTIFSVLVVSLALGLGAGIYILTHFATYEPKLLERVPQETDYVARLNVQQAVVYSPLIRHVLPVFERGRDSPESREKHLERKTTLELKVDVRELIFAELGEGRWLLLAGGFLRADPVEVLAGVGRMLQDEGLEYAQKEGLIIRPSGVAFCVAGSGTLVLGRRAEDVRRACGEPGKPPSFAAGMLGPGVALAVYAKPRERIAPGTGAPSHLRGGLFVVEADSHFPLWADLNLIDGDWDERRVAELLSSKANDFSYLVPLAQAKQVSLDGSRFQAQGNLSREQFDQSVAQFARRIEEALVAAGEP
jgi:hypothetical protein